MSSRKTGGSASGGINGSASGVNNKNTDTAAAARLLPSFASASATNAAATTASDSAAFAATAGAAGPGVPALAVTAATPPAASLHAGSSLPALPLPTTSAALGRSARGLSGGGDEDEDEDDDSEDPAGGPGRARTGRLGGLVPQTPAAVTKQALDSNGVGASGAPAASALSSSSSSSLSPVSSGSASAAPRAGASLNASLRINANNHNNNSKPTSNNNAQPPRRKDYQRAKLHDYYDDDEYLSTNPAAAADVNGTFADSGSLTNQQSKQNKQKHRDILDDSDSGGDGIGSAAGHRSAGRVATHELDHEHEHDDVHSNGVYGQNKEEHKRASVGAGANSSSSAKQRRAVVPAFPNSATAATAAAAAASSSPRLTHSNSNGDRYSNATGYNDDAGDGDAKDKDDDNRLGFDSAAAPSLTAPPVTSAATAAIAARLESDQAFARHYRRYQLLAWLVTFLQYAVYHVTRRPYSIVKSAFVPDGADADAALNWEPFVGAAGKRLLGLLDTLFLASYAVGLFGAGHIADRSDLRLFLALGLLGVGVGLAMWPLGFVLDIHAFAYYAVANVFTGLMQASGWPAVVAVMSNWFAKGSRGCVMGVWNAHTSIGNVLGVVIATSALSLGAKPTAASGTPGWVYAFAFPALVSVLTAAVTLLALTPTPEEAQGKIDRALAQELGGGHALPASATDIDALGADLDAASLPASAPADNSNCNGSGRGKTQAKTLGRARHSGASVVRSAGGSPVHNYGARARTNSPRGREGADEDGDEEEEDGVEGGGRGYGSKEARVLADHAAAALDRGRGGHGKAVVAFTSTTGVPVTATASPSASMSTSINGAAHTVVVPASPAAGGAEGKGPAKNVTFLAALLLPGVLEYSFTLFFTKLVAYTFLFWLPYYLESTGYQSSVAGYLSTTFDVGGIVGGVVVGYLSDKTGRPALISSSALLLTVPVLLVFRSVTAEHLGGVPVTIAIMTLLGVMVNGPYALITTAVSADLGSHPDLGDDATALAAVSGIIDGFGTAGAATQGILVALVAGSGGSSGDDDDGKGGWDNVFYLLMASCCVAALLIVRLVVKDVKAICRARRRSARRGLGLARGQRRSDHGAIVGRGRGGSVGSDYGEDYDGDGYGDERDTATGAAAVGTAAAAGAGSKVAAARSGAGATAGAVGQQVSVQTQPQPPS